LNFFLLFLIFKHSYVHKLNAESLHISGPSLDELERLFNKSTDPTSSVFPTTSFVNSGRSSNTVAIQSSSPLSVTCLGSNEFQSETHFLPLFKRQCSDPSTSSFSSTSTSLPPTCDSPTSPIDSASSLGATDRSRDSRSSSLCSNSGNTQPKASTAFPEVPMSPSKGENEVVNGMDDWGDVLDYFFGDEDNLLDEFGEFNRKNGSVLV
jgi:hypothetical protein